MAVGDQAADDRRIGERRADQAGRARAELAHRIEEMGDRARAGGEGGARLLCRRLGVAEADDDPRRGEAGDERRTGGGRRQGDDHRASLGGDELVAIALAHRADELLQMHAFSARVDVRPLDMDAERAGRGGAASPAAASAAVSTAGESVITVGRIAVTPARR